jgi:hypothetical protein
LPAAAGRSARHRDRNGSGNASLISTSATRSLSQAGALHARRTAGTEPGKTRCADCADMSVLVEIAEPVTPPRA